MKFNRSIVAAILAGLLALGAVACETDGEDPLIEDDTTNDTMTDEEPVEDDT